MLYIFLIFLRKSICLILISLFIICLNFINQCEAASSKVNDLKFLYSIDTTEIGQKFISPQGLYYNKLDGSIYIVDKEDHKIFKAKKDGSGLREILKETKFDSPYEIAVDDSSRIYISQLRKDYIAVFQEDNGQLERKIPNNREARLLDLSIMPGRFCLNELKSQIYIIDRRSSQIFVFSLFGNYLFQFGGKGEGKGKFSMISGIAVDDADRIYVTDARAAPVQVFDPLGNFLYGFCQRERST